MQSKNSRRASATFADNASELGRRLAVSKQAAAKTIGVLQKRGYVVREVDPVDARRKRLRVTAHSLGIVVYEWVSGDRPFHGSFTELCTQHIFAPLPPLREKVPEVPIEVEQVVQTALAKDPKEHFQSIQAFAIALEQAAQSAQPGLPLNVNASMPTQSSPSIQATPPSANQTLPPTVITPALPPSQPLLPTSTWSIWRGALVGTRFSGSASATLTPGGPAESRPYSFIYVFHPE